MSKQPLVWVDADSCPYKEEIIAISKKFKLDLCFVSNVSLKSLEGRKGIKNLVSSSDFDAVDDLIFDKAQAKDFAVTKDLLLAKKLVEKGVLVCGLKGKKYGEDLADALAHRNLNNFRREEQGGFNEKRGGAKVNKAERLSAFKNNFHNFLSNHL